MIDPTYYEAKKAWERELARRRQAKPGGRPVCSACTREIVFVKSAKSGRPIPCDPQLDFGDGHRTLVTLKGLMIPKASPKVLGREPHFGTCPVAKKQRERERMEKEAPCPIYRIERRP